MALNKSHFLLFLLIAITLLLGVTMVSATSPDNNNAIKGVIENQELSTPNNFDVDKMVQSSTGTTGTDAKVKETNTSDKTINSTNTENSNKKTETTSNTSEKNITSYTKLNKGIQRDFKTAGEETSFTYLQQLIEGNSVLDLDQSYEFTEGIDDALVNGITINKTFTLNGNGFTIDAKNNSRIFMINGTDIVVNINNVKLVNGNASKANNNLNGGAINVQNTIIIENSTFVDNIAENGGAIFATKESNAEKIENIIIKNCTFTRNVALKDNGGAIDISEKSENIKVLDSNFTDNKVIGYNNSDNTRFYGSGGAIAFAGTSSKSLIDNTTFTNNSVNANGGAVLLNGENCNITSCKFYNNSAPYAAGAVRLNGKHLFVNNSIFDGNYDSKGNYSWGSAIYLTGDYCNITYSNFTNNNGSKAGGAVAIDGSNEILKNDIFINNSATFGGAVFINHNENVTFDNSIFINNTAIENGGAISLNSSANNTKILNSNFTNNMVIGYNISSTNWRGDGGAVFFGIDCSNELVDNSIFINNTANANGGAIRWDGNNGNITSSKFYNNSAPYAGGALRLTGNDTLVKDSVFDGNYDKVGSYSWGSAIYISGNGCNITYSNFTNNTKSSRGGAVYVYGNQALLAYNNMINNSAVDGGAIYISGNDSVMEYNNLTANKATTGHGGALYASGSHATISYSNYDLNTGQQGGAIYWTVGSTGDFITECNFTNSHSTASGGSIFWQASSYVSLTKCNFINSSTSAKQSAHGGAVDFYSNTNGLVDNCTFINCSGRDGGALYFANDNHKAVDSVVSNCYFINCSSNSTSGGALTWKEANGHFINDTFINCSAAHLGGAILMDHLQGKDGYNNEFINITIVNCNATNGGGAIAYRSGTRNNTLINCTFANNTVSSGKNGGAIFFSGQSANATYDNCSFTNNTANYGGSIYYAADNGLIIINSEFANSSDIAKGGFVYLEGSKINITNTTFYNGSATDGGALYINTIGEHYISNNTFDYNNATNGGAVYIIDDEDSVTLDDSIYTNNVAQKGGAFYIHGDANLESSNITNNNATTGSGIYLDQGNLVLKNVRLLDNQAHSKEFANKYERVDNGQRIMGGEFTGFDNYLNAIYCDEETVDCEDVTYRGIDGDVNTDSTSSTIHHSTSESYQLVILEIYDSNNNHIGTQTNYTDEFGKYEFSFANNGEKYIFNLYHPEDTYYTKLLETINKELVNLTVNVTNITYGESESIKINVSSENGIKPTGNVTVYLNSTLEGFTNKTYIDYPLGEDGIVIIDEAPLDLLNVSEYDVFVRYSGDEEYFSENAIAQFVVKKAEPTIIVNTTNISYGENETVKVNITNINAKGNITVKVINSTNDVIEEFEFNLNSTELLVFNITDLLPDTYTINISYFNDSNYEDVNVTAEFTVKRQEISIHQLSDIYVDENQTISGVVTDGYKRIVTEGSVNITFSNGTVITYPLDQDGSYSLNTKFINNGTYIVNASYILNDKVRCVSDNREFNVYKIPTITNVTVVNDIVENVTIEVVVRENATRYSSIIENGKINVTVNGVSKLYDITGASTRIVLNDTLNITTTEVLPFTVEYVENRKYLNSTGMNSSSGKYITEIQASPKNSIITVDVVENPCTLGDTVNVSGQVFDVNGNVITEGTVTVYINGDTTGVSVDIQEVDGEYIYLYPYDTSVVGLNNVSVEYAGSPIICSSKNNTTFTVNKKPTNISITPISGVEVNKEFTIEVSLTNLTGGGISDRKVNITVNGVEIAEVPLTDSNGITSVSYTPADNRTLVIKAIFDEDDEYLANDTELTVDVAISQSVITVLVNDSSLYAGENVNITGKLVDAQGNAIGDADVKLYVNDTFVTTLQTNSTTGEYSHVISNLISGNYEVFVVYDGIENVIGPSNNTTSYVVSKKPTVTNVSILNNTVGNVTIDIKVVGADGNATMTGDVNITVAGNSFTVSLIEGEENLTVELSSITSVGDVQVSVEYLGNDYYESSIGNNTADNKELKNITAVKQQATITVGVEPNSTVIGKVVTINGTLVDGMNKTVPNEWVVISINGTDYPTKTDEYGKYSITNVTVANGTIEVIASFEGNSILNETSATTKFDVTKIPTITLVSIVNTTVGNVSIDVIVIDNETNVLTNGQLEISSPEFETFTVNVTGEETNIPLNFTTYGTKQVTVKYLENNKYLNSTGLDKVSYDKDPDTAEIFNEIIVTSLNTTITVTAKTPIKAGNSTIISGRLVDEQNRPIDGATVVVIINETEVGTATTDSDGSYTFEFNDTVVGTHDVTCRYNGDNTYNGSNNSTTFDVELTNTFIIIDDIEDVPVGNNVYITGKLEDEFRKPLSNVEINITFDGQTQTVKTDNEGNYNYSFPTTSVGTKEVKVEYLGNGTFTNATAQSTAKVVQIKGIINDTVPNDARANKTTTVNGTLVDETGKPLGEIPVNVTVNNKTYETTTNVDGTYSVNVDNVVPGTNNVTISSGNENVTVENITDKFFVPKEDVSVIIDPIDDTYPGDNVTITGMLCDMDNQPIKNASITVTFDGKSQTVVTDENGNYNVSFPAENVGDKLVKVNYAGDDKYNAANDSAIAKVIVDKGYIELNVPTNAIMGKPANVTGTITDEDGNIIANLPVNVTINSKMVETNTDAYGNFVVPVENMLPGLNNVTVTAGNRTTEVSPVSDRFNAVKQNASISLNDVQDTLIGDDVTVEGHLLDGDGNPISGADVNVTVDGESVIVQTGVDGEFNATFQTSSLGGKLVSVDYPGNDTYSDAHADDVFTVYKETATIDLVVPDDAVVGKNTSVNGTITDANGKRVADLPVNVTVNGKVYETTTDSDGRFTIPVDNVACGMNNVTATAGNRTTEVSPVSDKFLANKENVTITVDFIDDVVVGDNVTVKGQLLDSEGNPIANAEVTVTVNGMSTNVMTNDNGNYNITLPTDTVGVESVNVEFNGNELYNSAKNDSSFNVIKANAIVTIDPIDATSINDNISITGKLMDERGNPIGNAVVTLTLNGEEFNVTTDENGNYELPVSNAEVGLNNVSVIFESEKYNATTNSTNFTLSSIKTIVTVDPVEGIIGEDITLVAHVTDEFGNNVTGGNLVFKINGITLRMDGTFIQDNPNPMKFSVVNGLVTYKMKAELYLRNCKNITASYSGTGQYDAAKANVSTVAIKKRNAELTVNVVPETTKQNSDIVFIVKLRDVTPNGTNTTCISTNAGLILKVNGITLKDDDGNNIYVNVDSTTVTYTYHVPRGFAGLDDDGNIRNYTVEAVYNNSMFYPDTRNDTVFHVERSIVNINYEKVTVQNNMLSVKATFTDYENNLLVGDNKICVKINGITYKENNETKYFTVRNGIVDLTGIKVDSGVNVNSVTLVTGDRQAYCSARETTTDITTS